MSAAEFIATFEGCKLESYQDVVGVWTIGYGFTKGVEEGQTITQEEAGARLADEVASFASIVDHQVQVPINVNQRDALTSLVYNIGSNNFQRSTLLDLLNKGDYEGAANEFPRWDHAGGREIEGLKTRRLAEQELFKAPVAEVAKPVIEPEPAPELIVDNSDGSNQDA